ncbi:MAG TPA: hypothetical protein VK626_01605 [Nitrospiraceae bacterium]|nr:hypothetical protein [Nitrospiraceae bacterium]
MSADSITFTTNSQKIVEGSTVVITARFRNQASSADVTPTNVNYRLDEPVSRCVIQDWTSLTPGTSVPITLTTDNNRVRNCLAPVERRQLIVASDKGLTTEYRDVYLYDIKNLPGVP